MVVAAVFMLAFAVAKANQCSSGGECPDGNKPNNVVSMLQTKLQMNALKDEGGEEMAAAQKGAAERGAAVKSGIVKDSSKQSPHGSLLQVRKNTTRSTLAQVDSHIGSQPGQGNRQPHVCILARVCGPHAACAPGPGDPTKIVQAFLASIVAQTYNSWELHLINGQGGGEVFSELITKLDDPRLSNGPSSPHAFSSNSWGYEATNHATGKMFHDNVPCEYFLFTNADNLYGRNFLEVGLPGMLSGLDLLGFNFVTRYPQFGHGAWIRKPHMPMVDAGFKVAHVDLGAVLVSANAMKESGIRFNSKYGAFQDWKFFEKILKRHGGKGSTFYPELQFVHQ